MSLSSSRIIYTEKGLFHLKHAQKTPEKLLKSFENTKTLFLKHLLQDSRLKQTQNLLKKYGSKRGQSLFFLENNKEMMDYHHEKFKAKLQKPTIFSMITDPYDKSLRNFEETSREFLQKKSHSKRKENNVKIEENKKNPYFFTETEGFSKFSLNNHLKNLITKPLILDFDEDFQRTNLENKKAEYERKQNSLFERIRERAIKKQLIPDLKKRSGFLERFHEETEKINRILKLADKEKTRFLTRLKIYKEKKFTIKAL